MTVHYIWSLYNWFVLRLWLSLALLIYIGTREGAEGTNGSDGGDRPRFCRHVGPVESSPACSICNMVCFMCFYLKTIEVLSKNYLCYFRDNRCYTVYKTGVIFTFFVFILM